MYYDFPTQILQLNLIFPKNQHKDTMIFRDMQLSSLIYIISRQGPKQKCAIFPNRIMPNCGTKFRQIAEKFQKYLHMSVILVDG